MKSNIYSIPIIGYLLRVIACVFILPHKLDNVNDKFCYYDKSIEKILKESEYFAENHLLDSFYLNFENQFRGSESQITERLKEYLPLFKLLRNKKIPGSILDIGCGRGELLDLLKNENIKGLGIDINESMIRHCKSKGLDAITGDAVKFLKETNKKFGAITGFHIVEHIKFNDILQLMDASYSAIEQGGFLLLETPNPENLTVGSNTFYLDPSHLKPLPASLLKFAAESIGFKNVEIMYIHPEKDIDQKRDDSDVLTKLYGPRDYAVIAYK